MVFLSGTVYISGIIDSAVLVAFSVFLSWTLFVLKRNNVNVNAVKYGRKNVDTYRSESTEHAFWVGEEVGVSIFTVDFC